ncbi:hypothetical protein EW146_g2415 [Bondarzewia mesenterica]|uniref:Uncharacterized protein n=1 Tax=Bondarzewia mesenterica TaxID=1095465 RepID=A0A4S4M6V3_9AGAM|nr:hypothetical protein EW146_g2415 [Bondarzewia mesenterica]
MLATAINNNGPAILKLDQDPAENIVQWEVDENIMLSAIIAYMTNVVVSTETLSEQEEVEPNFVDFSLTDVATIMNPRDDNNHDFPSGQEVTVAPVTCSHWQKMDDNASHCFTISPNDPLANHLKTLADFLRYYKISSEEDRKSALKKLTYYLVSTCWLKMRRRIGSWSSQGFIYQLSMVTEDGMRKAYRKWATDVAVKLQGQKDSALYAVLDDLQRKPDNLQQILNNYQCANAETEGTD